MSRLLLDFHHTLMQGVSRRPGDKIRAGYTLVEILFAMSILAVTAAVFGGLMLAMNFAWDHATNLEDTRRQATATLDRIKWMVQQSGTYRLSGQSTMTGIAVLTTTVGNYQAPDTLVLWSGGSNGGMHCQGTQTRLPLASEVVVYVPDGTTPSRLVEVTFPGTSTTVDFASASLAATIQSLLKSDSRQSIPLCDRLRVTKSTVSTSIPDMGNCRFELASSPSDTDIAGVVIGSKAWNALSWGQGLVASDRGLRTANVRIELLLEPKPKSPTAGSSGYSSAIPFYGSVNRQYVYQP